jgi:trimeric autotransporter adhesin
VVENCLMVNNTGVDGGAIGAGPGKYEVRNCVLLNNHATRRGGAVACIGQSTIEDPHPSHIDMVNCTLAGNTGGLAAVYGDDGTMRLTNCILWNLGLDEIGPRSAVVNNCDVEGGWPTSGYPYLGGNNIDADPLFVDAANGNLRLQADSPCIDAGTSEYYASRLGTTQDAPRADIRGVPRPMGGGFDIGAYEYFDPDVNGDEAVNVLDLQLVLNVALGLLALPAADVNLDGAVNALDIQIVINAALGLYG